MKYTTTVNKLNPHFVTGFCDAESCFYLNITKNPLFKTGWRIRLVFSIHLHSLDINLLYKIIISLIIYISFDFSTNQFQFVQEDYDMSYFDIYLGVDGLSIYFVLLTTIIIPIALLSN